MHPHAGKQHRAEHRARDDAAPGHQRLDRHAAPVFLVVDELGRRELRLVGPDGPARVVQVEQRHGGGEVDVGVPVGVDGAHVAPVRLVAGVGGHAAQRERMRHRAAVGHGARNDVLAEVVARAGVGHVALELFVQVLGVEDVDAHAGQRHVRMVRHARWSRRLLDEIDDAPLFVDVHHAEAARFLARHREAAHAAWIALGHVVGQHECVVHLVDVVSGEHDDVVGAIAVDDVLVLPHGVGRAAVPRVLAHVLLRGQQVDELVHLALQERPAALQVAQQAVRLVLRDDADAPDAGVHAVRQREIDDAELAAEIDRGLGAPVGQVLEPAAAAAGQHQGDRALREVQIAGQVGVRHGDSCCRWIVRDAERVRKTAR